MRERQDRKRASIEARHGPGLTVSLSNPIDPFAVTLWFESSTPWTPDAADLLDGVLTAWFLLGRLGGFNSSNLQLSRGDGIAARSYDAALLPSASLATLHDCGEVETRGTLARASVNLGTADELALDVLANALGTLARDAVPSLTRFVVGGDRPEWPAPRREDGGNEGGAGGPLPRDY